MSSLDPAFEDLLDSLADRSALFAGPGAAAELEQLVDVNVLFTGPVEPLAAVEFTPIVMSAHPRRDALIAAGTVPIARLRNLADLEQVEFVEAPAGYHLELEDSIPEARVDVVRRPPLSLTGRGVIVAIVDGGFDLTHPALRKEDGTSRVVAFWDQEGFDFAPSTGRPPQPYNFGWAFDEEEIRNAVNTVPPPLWLRPDVSKDPPTETDAAHVKRIKEVVGRWRHGTHVAAIAAGNGRGKTGCIGNDFTGVAPEADIVLVRGGATGEDQPMVKSQLVYALNYIWAIADERNQPVVVNLSQGSNRGPHDGTTIDELFIEAAVLPFPGKPAKAFVKSAGNEAGLGHHARVTVPPGGAATAVDVEFEVPGDWTTPLGMELWYPDGHTIEVAFAVPSLWETQISPYCQPDGPAVVWRFPPGTSPSNTVTIRSWRNDPRNQDNAVRVGLDPSGATSIRGARYALRLACTDANPVTADLWLHTNRPEVAMLTHRSDETTVTLPGTSAGAITVGNYHKNWFFGLFSGGIDGSSSHGPIRGPNPDGIQKPDLTAPGSDINSARADIGEAAAALIHEEYGALSDCCRDEYFDLSGTSMAAPHVTGVIALMMQHEPALTSDAIKPRLRSSARRPDDSPGTPVWDPVWGYGKLDAAAAIPPLPPAPPAPPPDLGNSPRSVPAPVSAAGAPGSTAGLLTLADRLREIPEAAVVASLISLHLAEVRGLINDRPRVAVAWHRIPGPRLLRDLQTLAAAAPIRGLDGVETPELVAARARMRTFLDALARFGSIELRGDVTAHGDELIALLTPARLARLAARAG